MTPDDVPNFLGDESDPSYARSEREAWYSVADGLARLSDIALEELHGDAPSLGRLLDYAPALLGEAFERSPDAGHWAEVGIWLHDIDRSWSAVDGALGSPKCLDELAHDAGQLWPLDATLEDRDPRLVGLRCGPDEPQPGFALMAPLARERRAVGYLVYASSPCRFTGRFLRTCVKRFAQQLSLHIESFSLHGDNRRLIENQASVLQDFDHQLRSPLFTAVARLREAVDAFGTHDLKVAKPLSVALGAARKSWLVASNLHALNAIAKGEVPPHDMRPLSLGVLKRKLIEAAEDYELQSRDRQLRITVHRDSWQRADSTVVLLDENFFEQVLGVLLDNARKYSYNRSTVIISAGAKPRPDDDALVFEVANKGLPLTKAQSLVATERGWRGPSAERLTGEGAGIGLWLAKHLVEAMGGTLQVGATGADGWTRVAFRLKPRR